MSEVIEQVGEGLVEDTGPTKDINICIVNIINVIVKKATIGTIYSASFEIPLFAFITFH